MYNRLTFLNFHSTVLIIISKTFLFQNVVPLSCYPNVYFYSYQKMIHLAVSNYHNLYICRTYSKLQSASFFSESFVTAFYFLVSVAVVLLHNVRENYFNFYITGTEHRILSNDRIYNFKYT